MLQSPDILKLPKELSEALSKLVIGATFSEENVHDDCLPLLLVKRAHAVIAFAVGEMNDYVILYEAFKKLYLKRASEWSSMDVSFVYCIPSESIVDEAFRSEVEVNVYFCRKYVVHLKDHLAESLSRLPFIPLSPVSQGKQARPPSAQTLLQQAKLKADLAKALVVPAISSPGRILEDCIEGRYGEVYKISQGQSLASLESQIEDRVQTTLKSISIENFRAYRKKKEFALGSAITVLYGPNGFGKTSFFDAIDFVVTGGVGRLSKASGGLLKAAKHLDSGIEPTKVCLSFEREGSEHIITRDLTDQNNALVDGKVTSRKDVLALLTGGVTEGADRVDNMVSLFRATHLFSQDNQELTRYVAEKCELPSDIVSRMLAFEDYVSGLKKAEDVLTLARKMYKDEQTKLMEINTSISADREELMRLEGLVAENATPRVLDEKFTELRQEISSAGFKIAGIEPQDTRALRAMLESSAVEVADKRETLSKAIENAGSLKTLVDQLKPIAVKLDERKSQLEQAQLAADKADELLSTLTREHQEAKAQEKARQNQRDWSVWAVSAQSEYAELSTQGQVLSDGMTTLRLRVDEQRNIHVKALNFKQQSAAAVQRCESTLTSARDSRSRMHAVSELAALWKNSEPKLIAAQALEGQLQQSVEKREDDLVEAERVLLAQQLQVAQFERELNSAKNNDTSLKGLIAELRAHVDGPTCLLCGHDHGSQNELLAAIDLRMQQGDDVIRLSEALAIERVKLKAAITSRQTLVDGLNQETQLLEQTKAERKQLEQQRSIYETALNSVGVSLSRNSAQQLQQMSLQTDEAEQLALEALNDAKGNLVRAETALTSAFDDFKKLEREHQASSAAFEDAKRRMNELESEANRGAINLASPAQALNDAKQEAELKLAQASSSAQASNTALDVHKANCFATKLTLATARTNHQDASQTWNTYQTKIQSLVTALSAAGFESDVSSEELHEQIKTITEREVAALSLRDRVAKLEVAIDTAATSAAFQNLRERIEVNEKLVEQADYRALKVKPWITYFEDITKLLGSQQAIATKHFITEYGPRTAVIQQRLRPVYGFGEIEVASRDSAISVRVQRKGEILKPTDYFSQSQIQTLVLGLFLTACSSQTWSGFSSIMMDDPVTHFDDLNTYALLDLILGLQSSPEGARQFVISTCDEKLLQLARQKFKHMGAAAKFYRFSAVGASGPMVDEIII